MKIIEIDRQQGCPMAGSEGFPRIVVHPASTVIRRGMPFFIPGYGQAWSATPAIALRLCRLGKSIEPQFAARYVDAIAPALTFLPDFAVNGRLDEFTAAIDSTIAIGDWQSFTSGMPVEIKWKHQTISTDIDLQDIITTLSRFITMQMGDVIFPFRLGNPEPCTPEACITLTIDSGEALEVRIK